MLRTLALTAALALGASAPAAVALPRVEGMFVQLHQAAPPLEGRWDRLGVRETVVQWSVADDIAFVPGAGLAEARNMPDWARVKRARWARRVIFGLATRMDETAARADIPRLAAQSAMLARRPMPVRSAGWYFPVEVDPTWTEAATLMPAALADLPRPLWISVYDRSNIGGEALADWLESWLPRDVGIFFQDGVGLHDRRPETARAYADTLRARLGRKRVRLVVEAFREITGSGRSGRLRPATGGELAAQLRAYRGHRLYLFEGPHYVPDAVIDELTGRHRANGRAN